MLTMAAIAAILFRKHPRAKQIPIATAAALCVTKTLKVCIDERRPTFFSDDEWSSFPSGHSAATSAFMLGLAHLSGRKEAYAAAIAASVAVNALRVETRKHWPHDVIAGDLVAVIALGTTAGVSRWLGRESSGEAT